MAALHRSYTYVGPEEIRRAAVRQPPGTTIVSVANLQVCLDREGIRLTRDEPLTLTFVIDGEGRLRIASRHSEHVACAAGEPVLSAGEITFAREGPAIVVDEVTNQSTGYCPEPDSWPAVEQALRSMGISGPNGFTREYHFRRCPDCATINLIKDEVFECAVCTAALPREWNLCTLGPK